MAQRVLIVDDLPEVRVLVRTRLRLSDGMDIVGEAESGTTAVQMARDLRPDAVVLDLKVPGVAGRSLFSAVTEASPSSRVVVFTAYEEDRAWYRARGVPVVPKEDLAALVTELVGFEAR